MLSWEHLRYKRIIKLFYVFFVLLILLLLRLAIIQFVDGKQLAIEALGQSTRTISLEQYERGNIFDRNMNMLTGNNTVRRIALFPELIKDKQALLKSLSVILNKTTAELENIYPMTAGIITINLTLEQAKKIKDLNVTGCICVPYTLRYQDQSLAAHLIGYIGAVDSQQEMERLNSAGNETEKRQYTINDYVGKEGLEKYYEPYLRGSMILDSIIANIDARGELINRADSGITRQQNQYDPARFDIVLTLDQNIQQIVEKIMDEEVEQGAAVVMEAKSGNILAAVSRPDYQSAGPSNCGSGQNFINRTTALYQPGSVFKVVTAAAALEEGIVSEDSLLFCSGTENDLIKDFTAHGLLTFSDAVCVSCNSSFAEVGNRLGAGKLIKYAQKLGMGNQNIIGYPLQADSRQDLQLIAQPNCLINSSIGQGPVLATPVQITAMMNAIVNDGLYQQPCLVSEILNYQGQPEKVFEKAQPCRAVSADTSKVLRDMLERVTTEGTGKAAYISWYGSAGKTGSAETGSGKKEINAWFCGYSPLNNPQYIVTVMVENGESGSETAAPVFKRILEEIY